MRVAITGASGFIGRAVVSALLARGHDARAIDRAAVGDLGDAQHWSPHLVGSDAVVHLAALAHARHVDAARLRAVNVDAAIALGRAAAEAGIRMLHVSSVKVLGEETRLRPFDESSPPAPQDAYARAKAAAEVGLRTIPGLALTLLRPPLVYGPGVKANFLTLMRAVARGWPLPFAGIENRRSLVYVGNFADAVVRCVEVPLAAGNPYSVTDGEPLSTPALCRALGAALGTPARLFRFPTALLEILPASRRLTRSLVVDDSVLRRELGWSAPHTVEDAMRLTAQWYRTQGG